MVKRSVKLETIIRTVCLFVALANQCLMMVGKSPLPIGDETLAQTITLVATVCTSLWAWWKNNSFTQAAIIADEEMEEMKERGI